MVTAPRTIYPVTNAYKALKDEITRLARKAVRTTESPASAKRAAALRRDVANLKRLTASMQKEITLLRKAQNRSVSTISPAAGAKSETRSRITAKGVVSTRKRLGLTLSQMAALCDCSAQTIYNWESEASAPNRKYTAILVGLRSIGRKEALARLESINASPKKKSE